MNKNIKNIEKGKFPPQAIDIEEAVIGAMLVDSSGVDDVIGFLKKEHFYKEAHKFIYEAIHDLVKKSEPIDLLTVSNQLIINGSLELVGGHFYLIELSQKVSSSAHIEHHSRIVMERSMKRDLIKISNNTVELSYDPTSDVFKITDEAYNALNLITETTSQSTEYKLADLIQPRLERANKIYNKEIKSGIQTPFALINKVMGGWRDSELIIIAARPGMGKTAFVLACGKYSAENNIPTAFFSLEMGAGKLAERMISMGAHVDSEKFNTTGLSKQEIKNIETQTNLLSTIPFYVDDNPSMTIIDLKIKAKRMVSKYGIKLIIVDYLQLMEGFGGNREQEISGIARGLKLLAKELNLPVIALSQLSRSVETRGGSKRPMLSDLRESGAIEQDADVVSFIYRPEYYAIEEWDDDERGSTFNQAEFIVAKNRNGGLIKARINFQKEYTLFTDIENSFYNENNNIPLANPKEVFGYEDDAPF